jgi:hypothetical protein
MKKELFSKRSIHFYGIVAYFLIISTAFLYIDCKHSNEPEENYCGMLSRTYLYGGGECPTLNVSCQGTLNSSISVDSYDKYGRPASGRVSISCSGKNYTLSFDNIVYNSLGQIQSYDATVNGHSCHYTRE